MYICMQDMILDSGSPSVAPDSCGLLTPRRPRGHCSFTPCASSKTQHHFYIRISLTNKQKLLILVNSDPWVHVIVVFCVVGSKPKITCADVVFRKNAQSIVSWNGPCSLEITSELAVIFFRFGYLTDVFSKVSKVNLWLQGKQRTILAASDEIQAFKWKLILENPYPPPWFW